MELLKVQSPYEVAMFNAVIEAGLNALKSAIVINGGAAVALLAFIGGLLAQPQAKETFALSEVGFALLMFLFGTGCAGAASGGRYLSQFFYAGSLEGDYRGDARKGKMWRVVGNGFNWLCILLGLASYGLFFYGGWHAYIAVVR